MLFELFVEKATIAYFLELILLLSVILGKWILPKGNISRSALSQLLLVYMSLASDIVDLLTLLNEKNVQESTRMTCFTLSIFSWSLLQFSLNLIVSRGRSIHYFKKNTNADLEAVGDDDDDEEDDNEEIGEDGNPKPKKNKNNNPNEDESNGSCAIDLEKMKNGGGDDDDQAGKSKRQGGGGGEAFILRIFPCITEEYLANVDLAELWSIMLMIMFQDGPFLILRLTAVIKFDVRTFATM